jgi:nucleotide-binding universal stress UspA family protein
MTGNAEEGAMPKCILVPLDGSTFAEHALPTALMLARRAGAQLHLVQVHEIAASVVYPDGLPVYDQRWDGAQRALEDEYLRSVASRCMERGVSPRTELLDGSVSSAVASYAAEVGIDLIVMTTHGRGGISRAWVGSVADALVRRGAAPVLLMRPHTDIVDWLSSPGWGHVLIPLDGSPLSEGIIEPAVELGQLMSARYTLMRVVLPLPFAVTGQLEAPAIFVRQGVAESTTHAEAYLDELANRMRARGLDVAAVVVVHSIPALAILENAVAHGCDSLALATHGRGGWSRIALGSVADKVMRGTQLPMLLYRAPSATNVLAQVAAVGHEVDA